MKTTATGAARREGAVPAQPLPKNIDWARRIRWCELGFCVAISAYVAACHFAFLCHRGSLWRDEVQMVNIALSPTLSDFWRDLSMDTFPALWPATVKCWSLLCGASDGSLQVLGLLVGLALLACVWFAAWQTGRGFPVLALPLFALCPTVIRHGDAVRGYGLGLVLLLLMYARVWKAALAPSGRRLVLGLLAAVLAVQCMYFNAGILLALGAAGAALGLRRRSWKPVLAVGGIGLAAASSLSFYYAGPLSRPGRIRGVAQIETSFLRIARRIAEDMNAAGRFAVWACLGVAVLAAVAAVYAAVRFARDRRTDDRGIFAGAAAIAAIASYVALWLVTGQPLKFWYYMPSTALLAVSFDAAFETSVLAGRTGRLVRLCGAGLLVLMVAPAAWRECRVRMTNVDLIAQTLGKKAAKDDLIVLVPWRSGVTFARYYRGAAPWTTLPDLGISRVQRVDILDQRTAEREPILPVLQRCEGTLRDGRRLWIVGHLAPPPSGPPQPPLPVQGPRDQFQYMEYWSEQMSYLLSRHATGHGEVDLGSTGPITDYEHARLLWFEGWR